MLVYSFHTCLLNSCSEPGSVLSEQNGGWAEAELVPVSARWTGSGGEAPPGPWLGTGDGVPLLRRAGLICHLTGERLISVAGVRHSLGKGPVAGRGRGLMRNSQKATEAVGRPGRGNGKAELDCGEGWVLGVSRGVQPCSQVPRDTRARLRVEASPRPPCPL